MVKISRRAGHGLIAFGIILGAALFAPGLGRVPPRGGSSAALITATPLPTVNPTPFGEPIAVGTPQPAPPPAAFAIKPSNASRLAIEMRLADPGAPGCSEAVFTRDGRWLVSDCGQVAVWHMPLGVLAGTLPLSSSSWGPLEISPDGGYVARGNHAELGWVELWNISTKSLTRQHRGGNQVRALDFNAAGTLLAAGRGDGSVTVWQVETGHLLHELQKYQWSSCMGMAFHPQRDVIAASGRGNSIRIWDAWSGLLLAERSLPEPPPGCELSSLAYSPDGQMLAAAMFWDGSIALWRGTEYVATLSHPGGGTIWRIAWSPDGKLLAAVEHAGPHGQQIVLWDVGQLEVATILDSWRSIATFSPDGGMLVTYQVVDWLGSLYGLTVPTGHTYLPSILRTRP